MDILKSIEQQITQLPSGPRTNLETQLLAHLQTLLEHTRKLEQECENIKENHRVLVRFNAHLRNPSGEREEPESVSWDAIKCYGMLLSLQTEKQLLTAHLKRLMWGSDALMVIHTRNTGSAEEHQALEQLRKNRDQANMHLWELAGHNPHRKHLFKPSGEQEWQAALQAVAELPLPDPAAAEPSDTLLELGPQGWQTLWQHLQNFKPDNTEK